MKTLTLSIILCVVSASLVTAQFNTGSKMVGASSSMDFGLLSSKDKDSEYRTNTITVDLTPRAAYFVSNGVGIGGDIMYSLSRSKTEDLNPSSNSGVSLGPFIRYYFKSVGPIRFFEEMNAGLGYSVSKYYIGEEQQKNKHISYYLGAGIGAAYFLADNFALESMLNYSFEHQKNKTSGGSHNSHSIMLNFGFSFFFNSLLQE
jgi:hypothetical protein